jgi:hypothetical protein
VAFDALVAALYGDVVAFEAAEEAKIAAENARHAAVRPPVLALSPFTPACVLSACVRCCRRHGRA